MLLPWCFVLILISCCIVCPAFENSAFGIEPDEISLEITEEGGLPTSIYQEFESDFYGDEINNEILDVQEELVFIPDNLVFTDSPVAIAKIASFLIVNHFAYDIHVTSVASESSLFYPVMFQPQIILPNESVSIQILFLPYYQENVQSHLIITTSQSEYEYEVKGMPVRNPYGLHPIVGIRIPAFTKFEQPIVIHNPYANTLHIKEVYTTENFLTLRGVPLRNDKLGSDFVDEGHSAFTPEIMWVIQPNQEREIITISIPAALAPGAYHGYVHIKTDHENMVLPVEIEVLEGAVYPVEPSLNFGTLTSVSERKILELRLFNTGYDYISVSEILPHTPDPQLQIVLVENPVLEPRQPDGVLIATLVYTASSPGKLFNKLLVVTNNSNAAIAVVEVAYAVTVLHGGVGFEHQKAIFVAPIRNITAASRAKPTSLLNMRRELVFTNYFNAFVSLQNVVVASCTDIFSTDGIKQETVVDSFGKWPSVTIEFNETAVMNFSSNYVHFLPKTCWLEVFTNISSHRIPIYIIDGALELVFMDADMIPEAVGNSDEYDIEVGSISIEQPRLLRLAFANENPVRIPLEIISSTDGICACSESSWPIGNNDEEAALVHLSTVSARYPLEDVRCSCNQLHKAPSIVEPENKSIGTAKSGYNTLFSFSFHNLMDHFGTFSLSSRGKMSVVLGSPYQRIVLNLHFTMIKGKFVTLVLPTLGNVPRFQIGRHSVFHVVTIVDFEEEPRDLSLSTTTPLLTHELDSQFELSSLNKVKSFTTSLFPTNLCTHSVLNRDSNGSTGKLLSEEAEGSSLWSCAIAAIKSSSVSETKHGKVLKVLRKLGDAMAAPSLDPVLFHKDSSRLKRMWARSTPRGIPLASSEFVVQSEQALQRFPVLNATLQSPFQYMPDSYRVKLPAARVNEVVYFYFSVYNPFAFPVKFSAYHLPVVNDIKSLPTLDNTENISVQSGYDCVTVTKMLEADEDYQKNLKSLLDPTETAVIEDNEVTCSVSFPVEERVILIENAFFPSNRESFSSSHSVALPNEKFYVISQLPSVWTIAPKSRETIGPFYVNQYTRVTEPAHNLFLYNNFTGVEKIEVWTEIGDSKLIVSNLLSVVDSNSNEPESLLNKSSISVSIENTEWMFDGVEVSRLDQVFYVRFVNQGQVLATVVDVTIDGISCSSDTKAGYFSTPQKSSMCTMLPYELAPGPGSFVTIAVHTPSSCFDPNTIQRKIILTLLENSETSNELVTTIYFDSSSELVDYCRNRFPGRFFRWFFYFSIAIILISITALLFYQIYCRYKKWIRFCTAKRNSNFQHSEILLRSSFAINAHLLHLVNKMGFQYLVESFVVGIDSNRVLPQKKKNDGVLYDSSVDARNLPQDTSDKRNIRNIDLRDILIPEFRRSKVSQDDLTVAGSMCYVDKLLKSRNIKPQEKKPSPTHHRVLTPSTSNLKIASPKGSPPQRISTPLSNTSSQYSVAATVVTSGNDESSRLQSGLGIDAAAEQKLLIAQVVNEEIEQKTSLVLVDIAYGDTKELALENDKLDITLSPVVHSKCLTIPEEVVKQRNISEDDDSPIFQYHGELLNSDDTMSPLPQTLGVSVPMTLSDRSSSNWLGSRAIEPIEGIPETKIPSPTFHMDFVDDDDYDDLLRTDEFGDAFGELSLEMPTSDYDNADFSLLQYTLPPQLSLPPQFSPLENFNNFSSSTSKSSTLGQKVHSQPPGLSLPRTNQSNPFASVHPIAMQQNLSMDALNMDSDPNLAWVQDLTRDYDSLGNSSSNYFSSPNRSLQKTAKDESVYWLQMNNRSLSKSDDSSQKQQRSAHHQIEHHSFFGPNSFFDSKTMDNLESLEDDLEDA